MANGHDMEYLQSFIDVARQTGQASALS